MHFVCISYPIWSSNLIWKILLRDLIDGKVIINLFIDRQCKSKKSNKLVSNCWTTLSMLKYEERTRWQLSCHRFRYQVSVWALICRVHPNGFSLSLPHKHKSWQENRHWTQHHLSKRAFPVGWALNFHLCLLVLTSSEELIWSSRDGGSNEHNKDKKRF